MVQFKGIYVVLARITLYRKIRSFCAIFLAEIFICAILYAFSISATPFPFFGTLPSPKLLLTVYNIPFVNFFLDIASDDINTSPSHFGIDTGEHKSTERLTKILYFELENRAAKKKTCARIILSDRVH